MKIQKVCGVFFSPTGTTQKITEAVAERIAKNLGASLAMIDLTLPESREKERVFSETDLVILGTPVYAGRVPNVIVKDLLARLKGNGALGVAVVVYGNRHFDDALIELRDILIEDEFQPIGGGAFIGEHSFSRILGAGRPDEEDLKIARQFGDQIALKCQRALGDWEVPMLDVEGNKPYRGHYVPKSKAGEAVDIRKVKPKTKDTCINCKICARSCPMGSIEVDRVYEVSGICIKCGACVKKCPVGAKYFDDPGFIYHKEELEEDFSRRAEPKTFL